MARAKGTPSSSSSTPLPKTAPFHTKIRNRKKPGERALKEIRFYQKSSDLLLRKLPFARLVKEVQNDFSRKGFRWQATALVALQEAAESHLVGLFEVSDCVCVCVRSDVSE